MKIQFQIGEHDKHLIEFHWNQLIGKVKIIVDGKVIHKSYSLVSPSKSASQYYQGDTRDTWTVFGKQISLLRKWEFEVCDVRKRKITIEKRRPKWLAGLRPHNYKVFIDGQLFKQCTGYLLIFLISRCHLQD